MVFFYNISIKIVALALKFLSLYNEKIRLGVKGRSRTFKILLHNLSPSDRTIWFHCASLGEYEQGFPIFKAIRDHYKNHKIVLSFFSPSGYEIKKDSDVANTVVYLPLDAKNNANKFLDLVHPELIVFVKYDIWPIFLTEIRKRRLKAILISASFRKDQPYFRSYGALFRKALFAFDHIFTQNETSKELLNSIGYNKITVSGDTRFDRVSSQLKHNNKLEFIEIFKGDKLCLVAGSTWPEDEVFLIDYINKMALKDVQIIIVPHNVNNAHIKQLLSSIKKETLLYSEKTDTKLQNSKVLIVDTIGLLSKIYVYSDLAFVGGATGNTGLHNTLEPAVFGVPIIIGSNYHKFPEAQDMIDLGGMYTVNSKLEFTNILNYLINNEKIRCKSGHINAQYIKDNKGAVIQILNYLRIYNNFK